MHYRFANDYGARWPFWAAGGLCAGGDPALPPQLERDVREWVNQFEQLFDWRQGWPDQATADGHRAEGERLYDEVRRALPDVTITFHYWETSYRAAP